MDIAATAVAQPAATATTATVVAALVVAAARDVDDDVGFDCFAHCSASSRWRNVAGDCDRLFCDNNVVVIVNKCNNIINNNNFNNFNNNTINGNN